MPIKHRKISEIKFRKLLDKYVHGHATQEEIEFLDLYYEDFENKPGLLSSLDEAEVERIRERIRKKVAEGVFAASTKKGRVVIFSKGWVRAAAIIGILLAGTLAYLLIGNKKTPNIVAATEVKQQVHDVMPGGNKAILTLADGTKLVLDSANNGAITRQGNVTVIKLDDGLLSYEKASGKEAKVVYNTITTPRGGQYQLVLSDGSKVWLNAASSITYPTAFTGKERKVKMTGEAYFEVAHNANMPFHVKVGNMEVKVLGTHFNVNAYAEEPAIRTTLLEGAVNIKMLGQSALLQPGEQAHCNLVSSTLKVTDEVDVDRVVAWKNGLFSFYHAGIQEVMKQLCRWYDVEVIYPDAIPKLTFGGDLQRSLTLSQTLKLLKKSGIHFKIEGRKIIVMP